MGCTERNVVWNREVWAQPNQAALLRGDLWDSLVWLPAQARPLSARDRLSRGFVDLRLESLQRGSLHSLCRWPAPALQCSAREQCFPDTQPEPPSLRSVTAASWCIIGHCQKAWLNHLCNCSSSSHGLVLASSSLDQPNPFSAASPHKSRASDHLTVCWILSCISAAQSWSRYSRFSL